MTHRILDRRGHLAKHSMEPVFRSNGPLGPDRGDLHGGEDETVVKEAFGEDDEDLREADETCEHRGTGRRLWEHPLGGDKVVVCSFGEGGYALIVVDEHGKAGNGAGSESQLRL